MRILIITLIALVTSCGANDRSAAHSTVQPVPQYGPETSRVLASITTDSPAAVFGIDAVPYSSCGSDSDCAGFGKCSSGACGHCGSDSDCNGHGKCSSGMCGSCGSDSDCKTGKCSSGKCGSCGSDSDCKGNGKCSSGKCGSCGSDSYCSIGK
jgi:hypothetical protein